MDLTNMQPRLAKPRNPRLKCWAFEISVGFTAHLLLEGIQSIDNRGSTIMVELLNKELINIVCKVGDPPLDIAKLRNVYRGSIVGGRGVHFSESQVRKLLQARYSEFTIIRVEPDHHMKYASQLEVERNFDHCAII